MTAATTDGPTPETLLSIDPGRAKCGLAVVSGPSEGCTEDNGPPRCLERAVVPAERLVRAVADVLQRRPEVRRMLIGDGTNSATLRRALVAAFPLVPILVVDEFNTSARARQRFVRENPAPGWRRLLPAGLRSPEVPYDDYAAILLAEDYFQKKLGI